MDCNVNFKFIFLHVFSINVIFRNAVLLTPDDSTI